MKIYIKNTNDNSIQVFEAESYESLSKNFRKAPYEQASESEIIEKELDLAKSKKIDQCEAYLNKTDWYITRVADNGTPIPVQIKTNRELARALQYDINACTTIAEVECIDIEGAI